MGIGFYLSVAMLPVMIILSIIFFLKKNVNNEETTLYKYILLVSIMMTTFEIISALLYQNNSITFWYNLISKLVLISYISIFFLFCKYIMAICKRNVFEYKILYLLTVTVLILISITTTNYVETNGMVYPQGIPIVSIFAYAIILGIYELILTIINRKTIVIKKFTPLYIFIQLLLW